MADEDRACACVILGAVGDAMGYKGGDWEFAHSTGKILKDLEEYTAGKGVLALNIRKWMVSDDTVEHLHSCEGLVAGLRKVGVPEGDGGGDPECPLGVGERLSAANVESLDQIMQNVACHFKKSAEDFCGRAPGKGEQQGLKLLSLAGNNWDAKPFDSRSGGCGAAMRTMGFGLLASPSYAPLMLPLALEASRMSKTCPTGYLGGYTSAYFTYLASVGVPVWRWAALLVEKGVPACQEYLLEGKGPRVRHVKENAEAEIADGVFVKKWQWYIKVRGLDGVADADAPPALKFPANYGALKEYGVRDQFYMEVAKSPFNPSGKNPGACGLSAVLIAYDALLYACCASGAAPGSPQRYEAVVQNAVFHRGDNDSTGSIALSWYGALNGLAGVPKAHYDGVQYRSRAKDAGRLIYTLQQSRKRSNP